MERSVKTNYLRHVVTVGICFFIAAGLMLSRQTLRSPGGLEITPDFYLTHISTDKPIYRTGEKLYVRGVLLSEAGHTPGAAGTATFEIKGPKGDTVTSGSARISDSILGFSWDIPASQAGGEYTVRITQPNTGGAPAERKFDIRAYRAPRLKSQIVFVRDGYGPGDTVSASVHVDRAEGGIPAGAKVSVIARVDGGEVWKGETVIDGAGNASTSFRLPEVIARGEGSLAMIIQDGGTVETATKTIPILLQTLDLAIYPEGGDLVAGLPNRVYLEGRTPAQKPADIAGIVVNRAGREVATFRTEHEGRGRFSFVPAKGEAYSLRVTEPAGIKAIFPLPAVQESGVVIAAASDVVARQKDVVVRVGSTIDGNYRVALSRRGKEFSSDTVSLKAGKLTEVGFAVPKSLDGVIVATVYDDKATPRAERLLFRQPEHGLNVHVVSDRADYVPGDKVNLRVTTTDHLGKPVGAFVGLTVTDSSVLEMIDRREQAPRLPVMVLLENDVKNLADAHVYLDETNSRAPLATDLLLGTQGWRRFATVDLSKFMSANGDAARRALTILVPGVKGVVTDPSKALIPGVTVSLLNAQGSAVITTVTNESGAYAFPSVVPGTYRLSASLPGFRTAVVPNIPVPGPLGHYDLTLQLGGVNTQVEVTLAAEPMLFRAAATVGEGLQQQQIRDLPLVGNDVLNLLQVLPGVNTVRDGIAVADLRVVNADMVGEERFRFEKQEAPAGRGGRGGRGGAPNGRPGAPLLVSVREYAHTLRPGWTEGSRADFAETVYWNAGVKTDASTGVATVSFNLSDSVASFRVLADGFTQDGALGSSVSHVESVQPFSIEPKMPLQVTSGDVIQLPIGVINGMSRELYGTEISATAPAGLKFTLPGDNPDTLRAKERARRLLRIDVGNEFSGNVDLTLAARAGAYRDTVTRKINVQPRGFPYEISSGGVLESGLSKSIEFTLPARMVRGSLSSSVMIYPTPLASMTEALQALLREPYGCFEQTSSTSYPMVMAQRYFLTHTGVDPAIIEKTRTLLESSYKKLTGFESSTKGYEWFGASPGHEALTAYGLMQFTDMSQVRSVDTDMVNRTRAWLLARRDGSGTFSLSTRAVDSFGRAPADTTNAYITWALIESGEKGLEKEVASVKRSANATEDSYVLALAANILHATGDRTGARQLMEKLSKAQTAAGSVQGAVTSITRSGGDALTIETTALSVLAWMREPGYAGNLQKGLQWIVESNKSGRFGSTQSTILALRAIVAYDAANARPKAPGRIVLTVDGEAVGSPVAFSASTQGAIVLPEFASELKPGKHTVALRMEDGSNMPFSLSVKYHSVLPDSAEQAQVGIQVALKDRQVLEGGITEAVVSIANKSDQVIPTPVAIVGIPGGLEVRHDQLKELVKSGKIDAYEVNGREVVLYWRFLRANAKFDLPLSVVAAVPGSYAGPASRAYLYYTDEYKHWAPGLTVNIAPR